MKKFLIVLFAMLTALSMAFSMSACRSADSGEQGNQGEQGSQGNQGNQGNQGSQGETDEKDYGAIGEIVSDDNYSMSLLYVKTYDAIEGDAHTDKPTEGKQFVAFFLECRNDREDSNILLSGSFNAYADGVALDKPLLVYNDLDEFLGAGTIGPAKRMRLVAIFEATPGWKELELHYTKGILFPTVSLKFKATASEVAADDYVYTGSPFGEYALEEDALTPAGTMFSTKNWEITLLKAKKYDEIGGEDASQKPSAGKIFVMMFFEVKNISSEDNNFSGALFDCFADGCLLPLKLPVFEVEGYKNLSGEVAPDKTLTGYVCLETDKDFSSVEAVHEFSDKTVRFALTADMVE